MSEPVLGRAVIGTLELPESIPVPVSTMAIGPSLGVKMTSDEVVSTCPVTGQPDFYTVDIFFVPSRFIIESKSLKLYLRKFASQGIFGEQLAVTIRDELIEVIDPEHLSVQVTQKSRGGISITATSDYYREEV